MKFKNLPNEISSNTDKLENKLPHDKFLYCPYITAYDALIVSSQGKYIRKKYFNKII